MSATKGADAFVGLDVDLTISILSSFKRLAIQNNWKKKSVKYKNNRAHLATNEFSVQFGSNGSNIGGWQQRCLAVGIADISPSIIQCKKLLNKSHVNIFDLINSTRFGTAARTFSDINELAQHSKKNGKVFPKVAAKQNKLLKSMLRRISQ